VKSFTDLALKTLPHENDLKVLETLRDDIGSRRVYAPSVAVYAPELVGANFEGLCWSRFKSARGGSDLQKFWFDFYTRIAKTEEAQAKLLNMLLGALKVDGFTLDQDRRWSVLVSLNANANPQAKQLAVKESQKDKSDKGVKGFIAAQAAYPDLENKKYWVD